MKFLVKSALLHSNQLFEVGQEVELGEGEAAILLRLGAIDEIPVAPAKKAKADPEA